MNCISKSGIYLGLLKSEAQRFEQEIVNSAEKHAAEGKPSLVALPGVADKIVPLVSLMLHVFWGRVIIA